MKRIYIIMFCLYWGMMVYGQNGVNFEHLTLQEALEKARTEKKLVFVDCYTSWCGPCKFMAEYEFTRPEAGAYFNPKFVNVKFDMEKGEGPELRKKWGIRAYPSFLILQPDGTVQHRMTGSDQLASFIDRVERGLNKKTSLAYLSSRKKLNKWQLVDYCIALEDANLQKECEEAGRKLDEWLKPEEKMTAAYWPIMEKERFGSPDFQLLLDNREMFYKNVGKEKVDAFLSHTFTNTITIFSHKKTSGALDTLKQIEVALEKLDLEGKSRLQDRAIAAQISKSKDVERAILWAEEVTADEEYSALSRLNTLSEMASYASPEELTRMVALEGKYMSMLPNRQKEVARTFRGLKTQLLDEVVFWDTTFEEALEEAKLLRRPLFIDCYTSWCGPCRTLSEKVFTQKKIGDYLNKKFICLKYDMEKGEGIELAKKFSIRAYPTLLVVNPDGSMLHKIVGASSGDAFIKRVEEAFDDEKALGSLERRFEAGERDKAFLFQFLDALQKAFDVKAALVVDELMKISTDDEKLSDEYWFIFKDPQLSPRGSEAEKFLLEHRNEFNKLRGKKIIDNRLESFYLQTAMNVLSDSKSQTTEEQLKNLESELKTLKLENEKMLLGAIHVAIAVKSGDVEKILNACKKETVNLKYLKANVLYYVSRYFENATEEQKKQLDALKK